jgi:DNA helicase-2/ATP-dependent DNA helicase PcrA
MDETGLNGLEEERRLAYVGMTRARERLTISFAANRRIYHQWQSALPSRFIDELPPDHVEVLTPPGLAGGGHAPQPFAGSALERRAAQTSVYASPGWRRMQERAGERGLASPREVKRLTIDARALPAFALGARVFHQKFGYGIVSEIEGDKLGIAFEKAGDKKVVASFVTAAEDAPF